MLSLKRLTSVAVACLVLSCEPVDRDYGEYAVIETPVAYPAPAIVATGAPDVAPCLCMPTCGGKPLLTGGASGCEPTLGGDSMDGAVVRMAHGQSFAVYQNSTPSFTIKHQPFPMFPVSTFAGDVSARRFTGSQPVRRDMTFEVADSMNTIIVDPNGDTIVGRLPFASKYPGRVVTFKVIGPGALEIHGATDPLSGTNDLVDDIDSLWIEGTQSGTRRAVTLQAFDHSQEPLTPGGAGWIAVSSYP